MGEIAQRLAQVEIDCALVLLVTSSNPEREKNATNKQPHKHTDTHRVVFLQATHHSLLTSQEVWPQ